MRVWVFVIIFLPIVAAGQRDRSSLEYNYTLFSQADGKLAPSIDLIRAHVDKLRNKQASFRNDLAFLRFLFDRTNHQFFKEYHEYATFRQLVSDGKYNCLSGTAFYAMLLDQFEIPFRVIETNYHIFILASTSAGEVLLESTDHVNGFITGEKAVQRRIRAYTEQGVRPAGSGGYNFAFSSKDAGEVSITGLLGLLHYNQAIEAFNTKKYAHAITRLHHAFLLHRSAKMVEFHQLMVTTISYNTELSDHDRETLLARLSALRTTSKRPEVTTLMVPLIR